jgi:hypothetical protein
MNDYALIFSYKGSIYSFSEINGRVLDIEPLLKAIDEGKVSSLPEPCPPPQTP